MPEGRTRVAFALEAGMPSARPVLDGALRAARSLDAEVVFFGPAGELRAHLASLSERDRAQLFRIEAVEAPRAAAAAAARAVSSREADALVCACGPGAAHSAALAGFKRLAGVLKPSLAWPIPSLRGPVLLADAGPNAECKPWHLLQFAIMAGLYARLALGREDPSVGLLTTGPEHGFGAEAVGETLSLLKFSGINFRGPIRAGDIPGGAVDVAVCDGRVGHACRSLLEGVRDAWTAGLEPEGGSALRRAALAALLPGLARALSGLGCSCAAPILGVDAAAVCLTRLDRAAAGDGVARAAAMFRSGLNAAVRERIEAFKSSAATGLGLAGPAQL